MILDRNLASMSVQAFVGSDLVGAIVCKEEKTKKLRLQGYVAMLAVAKEFRHLRIGER